MGKKEKIIEKTRNDIYTITMPIITTILIIITSILWSMNNYENTCYLLAIAFLVASVLYNSWTGLEPSKTTFVLNFHLFIILLFINTVIILFEKNDNHNFNNISINKIRAIKLKRLKRKQSGRSLKCGKK